MTLNYPKEWFERSALLEGDSEVGAGVFSASGEETSDAGDDEFPISFGKFVELWRREMGWNSEEFAKVAGVPVEQVRGIESDVGYKADHNVVSVLAGVFEVKPHRLFRFIEQSMRSTETCVVQEEGVEYGSSVVESLSDKEKNDLAVCLRKFRS